MSACSPKCRKLTGARFEHCKVCHHTFGGHSMGNAHRIRVGTYVLAKPTTKSKPGEAQRFASLAEVPDGWSLLSEGNVLTECLPEWEMLARGWREVNGVWRGPKQDKAWWDKDEDPSS